MKPDIRQFDYTSPTHTNPNPRVLVIDSSHPRKISGFLLDEVTDSVENNLKKIVEEAENETEVYLKVIKIYPTLTHCYRQYSTRYIENEVKENVV